jgi:hypothetical protein
MKSPVAPRCRRYGPPPKLHEVRKRAVNINVERLRQKYGYDSKQTCSENLGEYIDSLVAPASRFPFIMPSDHHYLICDQDQQVY